MRNKTIEQNLIPLNGGACDTCEHKKHMHPNDKEINTFFLSQKQKWTSPHHGWGQPFKTFKMKKPDREYNCSLFMHEWHKKEDEKGKFIPCKSYMIDSRTKIALAVKRIKPQFSKDNESQLMLAILEQAFHDFFIPHERKSVNKFLTHKMPQAELCNVESAWITSTLKSCGFDLR